MTDRVRFGTPGRPFRRSPFWFGLAAGAGPVPVVLLVLAVREIRGALTVTALWCGSRPTAGSFIVYQQLDEFGRRSAIDRATRSACEPSQGRIAQRKPT